MANLSSLSERDIKILKLDKDVKDIKNDMTGLKINMIG